MQIPIGATTKSRKQICRWLSLNEISPKFICFDRILSEICFPFKLSVESNVSGGEL